MKIKCPECGEPARWINMTARVTCEITPEGKPGKVIGASQRVGTPIYICGGGHRWVSRKDKDIHDDSSGPVQAPG